MTEEKKAEIRQQATSNAQQLVDAMAPLYLGRTCPFKGTAGGVRDRECDGPACMLFTPLNDNPAKPDAITGGACGATLAVSRITELVNVADNLGRALSNLAAASSAPHILKT